MADNDIVVAELYPKKVYGQELLDCRVIHRLIPPIIAEVRIIIVSLISKTVQVYLYLAYCVQGWRRIYD